MIFNKQVRVYLMVFANDQYCLCPAQSAEHAKTMSEETGEAGIFYLGWTEIARDEQGYSVVNFNAQENAELLTGKELKTFPKDSTVMPQFMAQITTFLDDYYREERLERLENELGQLTSELAALKAMLPET